MTIDKNNATWLAIVEWAKDRRSGYERRLKTIGLGHDETQGLRYRLDEIEALLNVGNPRKMAGAALQSAKGSDV